MNVLQLLPELNIGGVERSAVEMARHLAATGNKSVVVSGGGLLENKLIQAGAIHYTLPVGVKNPFTAIYCYFKLIEIIKKENIDLVHARSRVPAIIGYFAAKSAKKVFLVTAHGQYKKHLLSGVMGWGKIVIVASDMMARYMEENFAVPAKKIRIIPRGVDLARFSFINPAEKRGKIIRIGMIARFTPLKGHLDFLKAICQVSRKISRLEVIIMGDKKNAKDEYVKKVELAVKHLMLEKIVRFVGPEEKVENSLKEMDIFVSANREQEAFGRSIIEAQARGVPVVATSVGGIVETVIDGQTGILCEPGNHKEMADKIMLLAGDISLREKLAIKARKNVEEKFSMEKVLTSEAAVYSEALKMKNILIFKMSALGDIILSVPSIRAVRKRFPKASVKVLVDVKYRKVLERCPYIDEMIVCDFLSRDRGMDFFKLIERIRSEDFDISIDLQNNRRSHITAFLAGITDRYGFDNGKFSFLINHKAKWPEKAEPPVDHQCNVLELLGIVPTDKSLELWPGEEEKKWVDNFLKANWVYSDQKVVGLALSASRKWKTKNWDIKYFKKLSEILAKDHNIRVILLGHQSDIPVSTEFLRISDSKAINAVGMTNIPQLIGLVERCSAIVSGDSAPIHIASAVNTPFVALFGPTDPVRHMPPAKKFKVIDKYLDCSPCYSGKCPIAIKCMTSISVNDVLKSIMEVIK